MDSTVTIFSLLEKEKIYHGKRGKDMSEYLENVLDCNFGQFLRERGPKRMLEVTFNVDPVYKQVFSELMEIYDYLISSETAKQLQKVIDKEQKKLEEENKEWCALGLSALTLKLETGTPYEVARDFKKEMLSMINLKTNELDLRIAERNAIDIIYILKKPFIWKKMENDNLREKLIEHCRRIKTDDVYKHELEDEWFEKRISISRSWEKAEIIGDKLKVTFDLESIPKLDSLADVLTDGEETKVIKCKKEIRDYTILNSNTKDIYEFIDVNNLLKWIEDVVGTFGVKDAASELIESINIINKSGKVINKAKYEVFHKIDEAGWYIDLVIPGGKDYYTVDAEMKLHDCSKVYKVSLDMELEDRLHEDFAKFSMLGRGTYNICWSKYRNQFDGKKQWFDFINNIITNDYSVKKCIEDILTFDYELYDYTKEEFAEMGVDEEYFKYYLEDACNYDENHKFSILRGISSSFIDISKASMENGRVGLDVTFLGLDKEVIEAWINIIMRTVGKGSAKVKID